MINIHDLNMEEEILPLYDFTFNLFSGQEVKRILQDIPASKEEIQERQDILKGFLAHREVFKGYSFSRFNLSEVYDFFETFAAGHFFSESIRWRLHFSEKERSQKRGRLILMVHLLRKIEADYLEKIDLQLFPAHYRGELDLLRRFLVDFDLGRYEDILRKKGKIKVPQMVELLKVITEKVTNGQAAYFWKRWFLFEAYLSISQGIQRHGFVFPDWEDGVFSVTGLFHPLLKNPVKNDIRAHRNVILLTGPNMSGKSTLLKAVSLCVYLGHIGLAVPASAATLPYFSTISVAINLTDSIVSGYSHFMSEVMTLKKVLEQAQQGEHCFAVFDELFRGTNIEDALEISTATIQGLATFTQSLFFISTHLHQLKDLEEIKDGRVETCYIECNLSDNTPAFTYRLKPGWSDLRLGRILFEREGLDRLLKR